MYHVAEALTRWLAPITSYTAEEIWHFLPGQHSESVFLETWYEGLATLDDSATMNREFWQKIMAIRPDVSKELEKSRAKGDIGSSLNAEIDLYCNEAYLADLQALEDELRFVFIVSNASVFPESAAPEDAVASEIDGVKIKIRVSEHGKCVRCWHQRPDVGSHAEHPELCGRCIENVAGDGEARRYA
jgi:isoleucyl-tRNA synthetase